MRRRLLAGLSFFCCTISPAVAQVTSVAGLTGTITASQLLTALSAGPLATQAGASASAAVIAALGYPPLSNAGGTLSGTVTGGTFVTSDASSMIVNVSPGTRNHPTYVSQIVDASGALGGIYGMIAAANHTYNNSATDLAAFNSAIAASGTQGDHMYALPADGFLDPSALPTYSGTSTSGATAGWFSPGDAQYSNSTGHYVYSKTMPSDAVSNLTTDTPPLPGNTFAFSGGTWQFISNQYLRTLESGVVISVNRQYTDPTSDIPPGDNSPTTAALTLYGADGSSANTTQLNSFRGESIYFNDYRAYQSAVGESNDVGIQQYNVKHAVGDMDDFGMQIGIAEINAQGSSYPFTSNAVPSQTSLIGMELSEGVDGSDFGSNRTTLHLTGDNQDVPYAEYYGIPATVSRAIDITGSGPCGSQSCTMPSPGGTVDPGIVYRTAIRYEEVLFSRGIDTTQAYVPPTPAPITEPVTITSGAVSAIGTSNQFLSPCYGGVAYTSLTGNGTGASFSMALGTNYQPVSTSVDSGGSGYSSATATIGCISNSVMRVSNGAPTIISATYNNNQSLNENFFGWDTSNTLRIGYDDAFAGSALSLTQAGALSIGGLAFKSGAGAPTTSSFPSGTGGFWKNTSDGHYAIYFNDGGTLELVAGSS